MDSLFLGGAGLWFFLELGMVCYGSRAAWAPCAALDPTGNGEMPERLQPLLVPFHLQSSLLIVNDCATHCLVGNSRNVELSTWCPVRVINQTAMWFLTSNHKHINLVASSRIKNHLTGNLDSYSHPHLMKYGMRSCNPVFWVVKQYSRGFKGKSTQLFLFSNMKTRE